jgi:hypothetical protein
MKKSQKKSGHNLVINTLSSIIFIILIVSIVNVGLSIFLEGPQYDDYCELRSTADITTQEQCEAIEGKWMSYYGSEKPIARPIGSDVTISEGYCDADYQCREEYEQAQKDYNQIRYYVFAILGLALFFMGAYSTIPILQYTGLASGAILLTEGIVTNFENKTMVFVSLIIILVIFGFLAFKKLLKKD